MTRSGGYSVFISLPSFFRHLRFTECLLPATRGGSGTRGSIDHPRWLLSLVLTLGLGLPVPAAGAGLADQVGATFALMIEEFVGAFPPAEGMVVAVEDNVLYFDLTAGDGVKPGQEFTVFRKGEVFRHPLTNRPLGRFEEYLGYAQVYRVHPRFTEARYIPLNGRPQARAEDGVRITRARIKVAVAPLLDLTRSGADLRRVPYLIGRALEGSKRFQVVDPLKITSLLDSQKARVEQLLVDAGQGVRLGRALNVAGWIVPIVMERGAVTYLDATWISAVTGTALFSKRQPLTRPEPAQEQRFPWESPAVD